jgi:hypothetical protein
MRKFMYVAGAVVVTAALVSIWARSVLAPSMATVGVSHPAPISPTDMTLNRAGLLPVELWDAF